ncbi:MAG TPA: alpha/beta hydrolase [Polyangiaceae bacterium]
MPLHLDPIVSGNEAGETIVFVQGWPDDASVWDDTVAALGSTYRCVRVNMPNYGGAVTTRWGHDTEEIVGSLVRLFRDAGAAHPVTLVLHDWGSYWGHAAHHRCPEVVARVVTLDVAPHYEPGAGALFGIMAYQGWLFGAFVVGGPVGNWMTRRFAKIGGAPAPEARLDARMNYPYRNVWADIFSGRIRKLTEGYWPTCPLLFVYGTRKPFPFHSRAWLDHVRRVGGEIASVPRGHWVMNDPSFVAILTRWLQATAASSGPGPRPGT